MIQVKKHTRIRKNGVSVVRKHLRAGEKRLARKVLKTINSYPDKLGHTQMSALRTAVLQAGPKGKNKNFSTSHGPDGEYIKLNKKGSIHRGTAKGKYAAWQYSINNPKPKKSLLK